MTRGCNLGAMKTSTIAPRLALTLVSIAAWSMPDQARACGGFFCDNVMPVVQTAERILFRINDDRTVTTIVEIQYQGPPSNFAWVLPISPGLTTDAISTAPAGLFDELEARTAPVFERPAYENAVALDDEGSAGCDSLLDRRRRDNAPPPPPPDTSGVAVVGEAVVGPYALELITAEQGENLSNWLLINGYQIPQTAIPAMDHYIGLKMAFLGVKLQADVPAGPIDALSFTYPGTTPSIPLILTSVAAATDMEIIAYVAGPGRHIPGNYTDLAFDYDSVRWTSEDDTDYPLVLAEAVDAAGGQAFNTEFADVLGETGKLDDTPLKDVLERDDYITRFHTFMSAEDMTADPYWIPGVEAPDIDNHHTLEDYSGEFAVRPGSRPLGALLLFPMLLTLRRRRPR